MILFCLSSSEEFLFAEQLHGNTRKIPFLRTPRNEAAKVVGNTQRRMEEPGMVGGGEEEGVHAPLKIINTMTKKTMSKTLPHETPKINLGFFQC